MTQTEKEEFLRKARERFSHASDSDKQERSEFVKDMDFLNGNQWPEDVRAIRENSDPPRPCLVINKIAEKVDQVSGDFRQSRPAIKVIPVDSEADPAIADIYAGLIRHVEYNSNAEAAYCAAYDSVITGGRGAWRFKVVTDLKSGKKQIRIVRVPNPLVVYWDPEAKEVDLSDARYMFITDMMPKKAFEKEYPKASAEDWDATDEDEEQAWRTEDKVRRAEYWYWGPPSKKGAEEEPGTEQKEVLYSCLMCASDILDGPHEWPGKYIPVVMAFGKELWIGPRKVTRGMVRYAREPQQMYNFWSSAVTEQIALAPTAPFLVTPLMISKTQESWDQQPTKNFHYLIYEPDPQVPSGPRREPPPMMSTAIAAELQRMEHDIQSAMGLYKANLGDEGSEVSGKAILARQREGDVGAYGFTHQFEAAMTHSGKILIDLIPKIFDTEEVIRIRGEDETEMEVPVNAPVGIGDGMVHPMRVREMQQSPQFTAPAVYNPKRSGYLNDLSVGTYDIRVDIGPSYSTQRQEAAEMLLEMIKTVPQIGVAAVDLVVKNLDVPGADELIKRLEKLIPQNIRTPGPDEPPPPPPPPDPELLKIQLEERDLIRKEFEAQVDAIAKLMTAESKEIGNQLQEMKLVAESIKAGMQQATADRAQGVQEDQAEQAARQQQNQPTGGGM